MDKFNQAYRQVIIQSYGIIYNLTDIVYKQQIPLTKAIKMVCGITLDDLTDQQQQVLDRLTGRIVDKKFDLSDGQQLVQFLTNRNIIG